MIIKLLFIFVLIFLFFLLKVQNKEKTYFFITILILFIRKIDVPYLGDIDISTIMITTMLLGTNVNRILFSKKNLLLLLVLFISLIIGYFNLNNNLHRVWNWFFLLFNVVVLYSLAEYYITSVADMKTYVYCILTTCVIFAVSTLIGYYGFGDGTVIYNGTLETNPAISINHSSRIYGISASNLVQIISIISICLIPMLKIKKRWIEYALILLFVFAGLVTVKRMTFIAIVLVLIYYIRSEAKLKNYKIILIVCLASLFLISLMWEAISYRFNIAGIGGGAVDDTSTQIRLNRLTYALSAFKESPLFGMGAGYVIYIHNGLYEILANCGILGTCIIFFKFIPSIKDLVTGNPWAVATMTYLVTLFTLESAINHADTLYFLGVFLGGYYAAKRIGINYKFNTLDNYENHHRVALFKQ